MLLTPLGRDAPVGCRYRAVLAPHLTDRHFEARLSVKRIQKTKKKRIFTHQKNPLEAGSTSITTISQL
jgi:hypothetical protein